MEELPGATQSRRVSFKTHHESASHTNGNLENQRRMRDHEHLRMKEKSSCSSHYRSLEIPKGPIHAMQFLCRSWSPSASHFLQIFPPSHALRNRASSIDMAWMENQEEKQEVGGKVEDIAQSNRNTLNIIKNISGWLRGKTMTSLVNGHRAQKKDEVRLHTAQVHAALSVAQLAAAIAGFAANSSTEAAQDINIHATNGGIVTRDKDMSAVASAAALVATVCAEAAESVGARRAHITSAVSSGLASRTSVDMMALTATAATCLRGATRLKSRATVDTYSLRNQKMLKVGVQLSVIMPSGKLNKP
ncbi:hypothetical protein CK203_024323 [Vitis vinifera]|uniref:VAN3-binding protein-like auxin canalisation domain-containing protein n=1 Tax=Vitis vinifera TaxID=29760 RepID=A0A438IYE0_VITVI|nr:hypothetical protein CK203_024323 [Vitis vinifera]